ASGYERGQATVARDGAVSLVADRVPDLRTRRWARDEAVVPSLPAVALDEAEAASACCKPAIGLRRAEIQLSRAAVQRVPRWSHPARIRVGGEERRLFGVGAEAG